MGRTNGVASKYPASSVPVSLYVMAATSVDREMGFPIDSALMTVRHSFSRLLISFLTRDSGDAHSMNQATALSMDPPTVKLPWFCSIKAFFPPKASHIPPLSLAERTIPPCWAYKPISSQNEAES